jgi:hypothetical protein
MSIQFLQFLLWLSHHVGYEILTAPWDATGQSVVVYGGNALQAFEDAANSHGAIAWGLQGWPGMPG